MLLLPVRRDYMSSKGTGLGIASKKKKALSFANRDSLEYCTDSFSNCQAAQATNYKQRNYASSACELF